MRLRPIVGVLVAGIMAGACASGGSSGSTSTSDAGARPRGSANLITEAEIAATGLATIYDVIERVRPSMFRARGGAGRLSGATESSSGATSSTIKVYLNGTQIGDLAALRTIQASSVKQVQYLGAADATTRFGTGVDSGAIVVTSK